MNAKIPTEMKALVRSKNPPKIVEVETIPVPKLAKGEVLIRVEAAPINPSDEYFAMGTYGIPSKLILKAPVVPGFEGAGTVVALGPEAPSALLNQRVAFSSDPHGQEYWSGSWGQYKNMNTTACVPIGDVSFEDACAFFVNPVTALGFLLEVKNHNSKGLVHTAAASSLGKMLVKLCLKENVELINVVRRDAQADELKKLGAKYVLNQNDPDFVKKLSELTEKLGITLCFDAVTGPLTGKLIAGMPPKSIVFMYGALDTNPVSNIDVRELLFLGKELKGFWMSSSAIFVPEELMKAIGAIQEDLKKGGGIFKPNIVKKLKMEECNDYIMNHHKNPTEGKTILLLQA